MSSSKRFVELHDDEYLIILNLETLVSFDFNKEKLKLKIYMTDTNGLPYIVEGKNASRIHEELKIHLRRLELMG